MNMYDLVIFDVDGTLLDTTEGILSSVKYTIKKYGLATLSQNELLTFIGPPIQNSFREYYSSSDDQLQEFANTFRMHYKEHDLLKAEPYNGIYQVFEYLNNNGIKSAIATYKRHDYANILLKHFHFNKYTTMIYGADNFNKLKKKDIIKKSIMQSNISDNSKILMVGDSDNDANGASEIGVDFLGVTYGFDFITDKDVRKYPSIGSAAQPLEIIKFLHK